ncbi:C-C motif chemokine 3-like [Etheostoma spectabile]|uniref:C-C motif chemokine 3-like n=1 Tax=Etheostoma spectabile TaxID=54343 RepID=UPI0013AF73AA|nr:C-C motif chemokine 3-like [Etheostoma spectabile]XP_032378369.1 C-C motif chemokine 3-like [Etheostoma spectabile]
MRADPFRQPEEDHPFFTSTQDIMKTLSFTVGLTLLLLTVHPCSAMPVAMDAPVSCCFQFFTGRVPQQHIISIIKTHSSCHRKAFVISAANGREICVSQNLPWAEKAFDQQTL